MGLGPDRYMSSLVHTTSMQVFRQNLGHFGTCTSSVHNAEYHFSILTASVKCYFGKLYRETYHFSTQLFQYTNTLQLP